MTMRRLTATMRAVVRRIAATLVERRRLAAVVVAAFVLAWLLIVAPWAAPAPSDQATGIDHLGVAHAAIGDQKGCDTCHAEAIAYTTCSDTGCHDPLSAPFQITPTTMLINFPHHDTNNSVGAPSDCQGCHAAVANDARFITIPSASHSVFCGGCHNRTHSTP